MLKKSLLLPSSIFLVTKRCSSFSLQMTNILPVKECIRRRVHHKNVKFIDGSWHLSRDRNARKEYELGPRIPNAIFFDIDDVATKDVTSGKNLPHMMPSKELFAKFMDAAGIQNTDELIVYGTKGCFSVPRTFYTIRECGHSNIHMMNGSLQDWMDAGGDLEMETKSSIRVCDLDTTSHSAYSAVDPSHMKSFQDILKVVEDGLSGRKMNAIITDARSSARFYGKAPEPRPGIPSGHMPGSKNVPFNLLLEDSNMSKFKPTEEMIKVFKDAGIDVHSDKEIITTCGSGVTACVIALALEECGRERDTISVFDGSWIEWASSEGSVIVTDENE